MVRAGTSRASPGTPSRKVRPSKKGVAGRPKGRGAGRSAKKADRGGVSPAAKTGASGRELGRWFANLKRQDGCAARVVVAERTGEAWDITAEVCEVPAVWAPSGAGGGRGKRGRGAVGGGNGRISARTCRALGAVGHRDRGKIMTKLLEGPATYRSLQRVTRLKAGPLYHHINQLRLAGLMLPKQRDVYELTRGGRNLILAVMAMGRVTGDVRRRPLRGK